MEMKQRQRITTIKEGWRKGRRANKETRRK
jgi:hypothetical protein